MKKSLFFTFAVLGFSFSGVPRGLSQTKGLYEISKVRGSVQVWQSFAYDWRPAVEGQRLLEGTLLLLEANAVIQVRGITDSRADRIPKGIQITSVDPIITRLDDLSIRKVKMGGYFVKMDVKKEQAPDMLAQLGNAWKQAVSVFDDSPPDPDAFLNDILSAKPPDDTIRDPTAVADDVSELIIKHPTNGHNFIVGDFPAEIALVWQPVKKISKDPKYKVMFWRADGINFTPIGTTEQTMLVTKITSGGRYFVKIETQDGKYRTKTHSFTVSGFGEEELNE